MILKKFTNIEILNLVKSNFKLDLNGYHGLDHWLRVYNNCLSISKYYKINSEVFELFALLHDSKREDEDKDLLHGKRAALFIKDLIKYNKINLSKDDARRLIFACSNHTRSNKKAKLYQDLVVQICFDADRLDIGRVGIVPEEQYFQTDYAKKIINENKYYFH